MRRVVLSSASLAQGMWSIPCNIVTSLAKIISRVVLNMQLSEFSAEPSGPWDGGDDIVLSISVAHMASLNKNYSYDFELLCDFLIRAGCTSVTIH